MSYDLFFKKSIQSITKKQFFDYFSGRKNYTLEGDTACYGSESTGVHFIFEFGDPSEFDPEMESFDISFNLNFCRPMFFIKEAEPEVRAFVEKFKLLVADWQVNELEAGEYDADAFVTKWTEINSWSYKTVLENSETTYSLPSKVLNTVWEWNYNKDELQESLPDDLFVPGIRMASYQGKVVTFVVWGDAYPILMPKVDILFIGRRALAPRKFFIKRHDWAVGLWADFEPLLEKNKLKVLNGAYYLFYPKIPSDLVKAVRSLPPLKGEVDGIPSYEVLDREIMEMQMG